MAKGTKNHWTFRWLIVFPTQLFCSVCKIRLASPPFSPVLLLGLLISSLRVPFFLCGLAKVGGREACPCTCSNTTRFYSWFIPIYTTFFPRFQDTRRISTLLSIFFLIVCWDKKIHHPLKSSFLGECHQMLWSSLGIDGVYFSHWQTKIWWGKTCT